MNAYTRVALGILIPILLFCAWYTLADDYG
jgi:hypothetical protein